MFRPVLHWAVIVLASFGLLISASASAQLFSGGYEFLKAVKDRDGDEVTKALSEPGSVVINTRDISTGDTALHMVTQRRDLVWVRFLTQRGANPNIRNKKGETPLQIATGLGFVEAIEVLIKKGAEVDTPNDSGETPLIAAVHRRDVGMVRLLLKNGADPKRTDNSGRSARDFAELMASNSAMIAEFDRAKEAQAEKGPAQTYGPSL